MTLVGLHVTGVLPQGHVKVKHEYSILHFRPNFAVRELWVWMNVLLFHSNCNSALCVRSTLRLPWSRSVVKGIGYEFPECHWQNQQILTHLVYSVLDQKSVSTMTCTIMYVRVQPIHPVLSMYSNAVCMYLTTSPDHVQQCSNVCTCLHVQSMYSNIVM